jgi:hypothetical protein
MYIPGNFNRINRGTVGYTGMIRQLTFTVGRSRRRIDVEFDRHVSLDEFFSSQEWRACLTIVISNVHTDEDDSSQLYNLIFLKAKISENPEISKSDEQFFRRSLKKPRSLFPP